MKAFDLMNSLGLEGRVQAGIPMRELTTMRVGGAADCVVHAANEQDIDKVLRACRQNGVPLTLVGRGSNLVVRDGGLRGVVLHLGAEFSRVTEEGDRVTAQAGATLGALARKAQQLGLAGLEFASGIPGTVGGAVTMNAGAYGGEMKDVISRVRVLDPEGKLRTFSVEELQLGYRASLIQKQGCLVVEAELALTRGEPEKIYGRMEELKAARKEKQPIEFASAGSTFKRPEGYFAGKLIMDAGLRGYSVGDAQVSEKHCGFVINRGEATAAQVMELIEHIQAEVLLKFGVKLEMEVKRLGDF